MNTMFLAVFLGIASLLFSGDAAPAGARITSLPGLSEMPSYPMYSGYVPVRGGTRQMVGLWQQACGSLYIFLCYSFTGLSRRRQTQRLPPSCNGIQEDQGAAAL